MTLSPNPLPNQSDQSSYADFESGAMPIDQADANATSAIMVQQRQILAMMGLDVWVLRDSPTLSIDYDTYLKQGIDYNAYQGQSIELELENEIQPTAGNEGTNNSLTLELAQQSDTNQASINNPVTDKAAIKKSLARNPIQALKQKLDVKPANNNSDVKINLADSLQQVEPFEIVGAHFKNWVLIADIAAFKDQQKLKLWENIVAALSLNPQSLKFPICEGISDKESANASVAGFIFRLAKNNEANVAALTAMPNNIDYSNIKETPTLAAMLADSELKKQFWQSVNQN